MITHSITFYAASEGAGVREVRNLSSKAKNQINNPALNNRRILIAAVFHFVAAVKFK